MIIILGIGGGGTSYFTKFLRYNGFYAGLSIEKGRNNPKSIGFIKRRKWHESVPFSDLICKPFLKHLGVSYPQACGQDYIKFMKKISHNIEQHSNTFLEKNKSMIHETYNQEFPCQTIPHGFKNPRSILMIPFLKKCFPNGKLLTVTRSMNPNPTNNSEGSRFSSMVKQKDYCNLFYDYDDDFRFSFEDFLDIEKVNSLLEFVGLETLSEQALLKQHSDLKFNYSKIGK